MIVPLPTELTRHARIRLPTSANACRSLPGARRHQGQQAARRRNEHRPGDAPSSCPSALIDLGSIDALKRIEEVGGQVRIGAMASHFTVSRSDLVLRKIPALAQLAGGIGDPLVRNRGTIGARLRITIRRPAILRRSWRWARPSIPTIATSMQTIHRRHVYDRPRASGGHRRGQLSAARCRRLHQVHQRVVALWHRRHLHRAARQRCAGGVTGAGHHAFDARRLNRRCRRHLIRTRRGQCRCPQTA